MSFSEMREIYFYKNNVWESTLKEASQKYVNYYYFLAENSFPELSFFVSLLWQFSLATEMQHWINKLGVGLFGIISFH